MPAGVGSPIFEGLENTIAQLIFGIPAVKGLEFGAGFQVAEMVGSQNNDPFYIDEKGHVMTKTNNHGGILGGISSGMPITLNGGDQAYRFDRQAAGNRGFSGKDKRDAPDSGTARPVHCAPCSALCGSGGEHRSAFPYDGLSAFLRKHRRLHL